MFTGQILSWGLRRRRFRAGFPPSAAENTGKLCLHCSRAVLHDGTSRCPPFWYNIQPMKQISILRRKKSGKKYGEAFLNGCNIKKIEFFHPEKLFCI